MQIEMNANVPKPEEKPAEQVVPLVEGLVTPQMAASNNVETRASEGEAVGDEWKVMPPAVDEPDLELGFDRDPRPEMAAGVPYESISNVVPESAEATDPDMKAENNVRAISNSDFAQTVENLEPPRGEMNPVEAGFHDLMTKTDEPEVTAAPLMANGTNIDLNWEKSTEEKLETPDNVVPIRPEAVAEDQSESQEDLGQLTA